MSSSSQLTWSHAGISDHAQKELGDIVYVDLPEAGAAKTRVYSRSNVDVDTMSSL